MPRLHHRVKKPVAQSPGTIAFSGKQRVDQVQVQVIDYDPGQLSITDLDDVRECFALRDTETITWINVNGLHDVEVIRALGQHFGIHPLALEDIVSPHQRPKLEDYGDHLYIVCRMLHTTAGTTDVQSEQLSLVLRHNVILSFQERPGDAFAAVRERLKRPQGRLRARGADYLCYALLDAVIDHYFLVAEVFGEAIEALEEQLLTDSAPDPLNTLHGFKRELSLLRRAVWPLREVMGVLGRDESSLVAARTLPFLRDAQDHANQVSDSIDAFRDMLASLQDLAMFNLSNRLNDVMKVLTIFASIFVPLTFVAGIYGMNFEHMPELGWRWSYPVFWVAILGMIAGMLVYFRRRKWL